MPHIPQDKSDKTREFPTYWGLKALPYGVGLFPQQASGTRATNFDTNPFSRAGTHVKRVLLQPTVLPPGWWGNHG